ncbi:uncharacterized protein LOC143072521 [Mytilus galloprovincialis]|uniref:uncharacterized protein LOC143072521 n=1 Tax=Mytilus galloprovincialis TaxID=29158 RepID=UPI003F7BC938
MEDGTTISFREFEDVFEQHEQHMDDSEEVQAPEVQAPEVQAPEVQAPEVQAPEVQAPEIQASEVQAPEVQATEVHAPEVQVSSVTTTDEGQPIPAAQLHTTCTRNVPKENDFVRVKFVVKARGSTKEQYFIGQVVELIDGSEPVVSFLKDIKDSQLKQWPDKTELSLVDPSMITDILQEPETVLTGRKLLLKFN